MSQFEILIDEITREYPAFLRASDLIDLGLYPSPQALCFAMKEEGKAPPHIRVSKQKILFPRSSLIEWLLEKAGSHKKKDQFAEEKVCNG